MTPIYQIYNGNLGSSSSVNSSIVPSSLVCLPHLPSPSSTDSLAPWQGRDHALATLSLIPTPELVSYLCLFPLMTPAGFFHCSFPNLINCPHTSSFFSSLSISGLPFSDPRLTPSQEMWLTYSSLELPDHSTNHFINNPTYSHSSVANKSACNEGDTGSIPGWGRSPGEGKSYPLQYSWASLVAQLVKNLSAMWETWVWSLGY